MKKLLSLLLCLALLLLCAPLATAEEDVTEITDAAGLAAMRDNPSGSYALGADIDLAGIDWVPMPFSGKLDGQGHTIYNLSVSTTGAETRTTQDGNRKKYETAFAGFFSTLENAEVRNLHLRGAFVNVEPESHCYAALLAPFIDHSSILDCTFEGRVHMIGHDVMVGVGGVCGFGCGDVGNCKATVELFFEDRCLDKRCEEFMGGILACGVVNITDCTVKIQGYDSCHGYVHNGGLIGMHCQCGTRFPFIIVQNNYVSGQISFFEDNPDRRAYCAPFRGEALTGVRVFARNTENFERRETFDYSKVLLPESCESPDIVDEVTPPGCDSWGFTRHACSLCGHAWTDSYTAPAHTPGPWKTVVAATVDSEGLEQQRCVYCEELLDERAIVPLILCESCVLDRHELQLKPGEEETLLAEVAPANATDRAVVWLSSNLSVVTVDAHGRVTAVSDGEAEISAQTLDGQCVDRCSVTVKTPLLDRLRPLLHRG